MNVFKIENKTVSVYPGMNAGGADDLSPYLCGRRGAGASDPDGEEPYK